MGLLKSKRIIAIDIGASGLKLAEFVARKDQLEVANLAVRSFGVEPGTSDDSTQYIAEFIQDIMREKGIRPAPVCLCVKGQSAFLRLVKLPPIKRSGIYQTIQYEAQANVPLPIEEVVWDYQLMGSSQTELNVMLVAIKADIVEDLTRSIEAAGLELDLVDVAPMAIYNAVRYNYAELQGCTMVIDIGAHATNLIFVEEGWFFSRTLPVVGAGNIITQQVMKECKLPFNEAEALKCTHASVALGGAYEDYQDRALSKVSKTVRSAMTKLHVEVERSINFYRTQQGGSNPQRLLLTGGTSVIARMDEFFREKLKLDVEYFNPFKNIVVSETITEEEIGACASVMGAVVGVALRYALPCPLEINLLPPKVVAEKKFLRKRPYLVAAAFSLVLIALCGWFTFHLLSQATTEQTAKVRSTVAKLQSYVAKLKPIQARKKQLKQRAQEVETLIYRRTQWLKVINAIHESMLDGMWLVSLKPVIIAKEVTRKPLPAEPARTYAGVYTHILIKGMIFCDKANGRSISRFCDRLKSSPMFTDQTDTVSAPLPRRDDYAREFIIQIDLKEPL